MAVAARVRAEETRPGAPPRSGSRPPGEPGHVRRSAGACGTQSARPAGGPEASGSPDAPGGPAWTARRRFVRTTDSAHRHPVAPNTLESNFQPGQPHRAWVGDITYVWTDEGWLYLAVLLDLFSRKVVGWAMGERIDRGLVLSALDSSLPSRRWSPASPWIRTAPRKSASRC
ncbi:hypothetical protein D7V93_17885 [Corallococcus llansteffanensis]|uniref:Integrase catalytic domain-containing protein n=1 Tax=Corallococcus llansteffanensis TaxID=2316731 RepID=A0A3A8PNQ3_9BACT|nr:hypothetical protein D7V93_17885 [Corallococcus llansteffanensis]